MAKRKRIALIYAYSENWIGGTYYIENLIAALNTLPDVQKPKLFIFIQEPAHAERLQQTVKYPYWVFRSFERTLSLPERVINKVTAEAVGRRFISLLYSDIDLVFPLSPLWLKYFTRVAHHLYWIPDFQEHYLPMFFSAEEIYDRKADQQRVVSQGKNIIFSSYSAQQDFNDIYPNSIINQHVLQFAVTNKLYPKQLDSYLSQYNITRRYFICSNQFWKHKNHSTLLRAIAYLKISYPDILVVFTGKEYDYRNPSYYEELMKLRAELGIQAETIFLGFIPRDAQLSLMKEAIAIIQPSLFEGWSTVVEDAKSLNLPLIVSDLSVHKEQLAHYSQKMFFSPESDAELVDCMYNLLKESMAVVPYDYESDINRFASEFINITQKIIFN